MNKHWFLSLGQARQTIKTWRLDYNAGRPHSALSEVPQQEFEQLTLNRAPAPIIILRGPRSQTPFRVLKRMNDDQTSR